MLEPATWGCKICRDGDVDKYFCLLLVLFSACFPRKAAYINGNNIFRNKTV